MSAELVSLRFSDGRRRGHTITWRQLEKHVGSGESRRQLLWGVSGSASPGQLVALMGPSGSGKTTLMNILGGRALSDTRGEVRVNGRPFVKSMKKSVAYVLQEDLFFTQLTVMEQLSITSRLRLPDALPEAERQAAVQHVIKILRIEKCLHTKIKLISGGEKKRCNIGTELLTNPSILLLDEPTVYSIIILIYVVLCFYMLCIVL